MGRILLLIPCQQCPSSKGATDRQIAVECYVVSVSVSSVLCMMTAMRTHEVNGQQCEVKRAQSKSDESLSRPGGGGRGM